MILLFFFTLVLFGIVMFAMRKIGNKLIRHTLLTFSLIVILSMASFIWNIIDWHSPHHWIEINPIVDASTQKEGLSGFVLPSGNYVIVVAGNADNLQDSEMEINYVLEIPDLAIRIEKQRKVDVYQGSELFEEVQIKKDKTGGTLKVHVLTPPRGKASVGLVSNKFAGM